MNLNIIFIGDSITYGATLKHPKTEAPPVYAVDYLQHKSDIGKIGFSNQGVSGFTTVDFLPATGAAFKHVVRAADAFYKDKKAVLIFSIMIGTNDSAIDGPNGSPVSPLEYRKNLKAIIDRLLYYYPNCRVVINRPIWYSPNTYNGAKYLQEGLMRLQSYFPEIDTLLVRYKDSLPNRVFEGDTRGFSFFKRHYRKYYTPQKGHQGVFYLHPNESGAKELGLFWGRAIYRHVIKRS